LLSNKKYYAILLLFLITFVFSCNEKEKKAPKRQIDISNRESALQEARKALGSDVRVAVTGKFDNGTAREFAAGTEINKPDKWGIQFYLLKEDASTFRNVFSTDLLKGSFTGAFVGTEKLQPGKFDMVYYNSLDYFIGSGGGEVFAYLIDFNSKQTYYAHLFMKRGRSTSLFLSRNMTPETKNFFLGVFKKDYPGLKIAGKDVDLDD
jgi:hypothetical protein